MKRIITLLLIAFVIPACDKSSDRDTDTSMRIKPGTLTAFNSPVPGTGTNYTIGANTGNYAIIYNGIINNTNYIGIACSNNPEAETYNFKLHYQANSFSSGTYSATIVENGSSVTENVTLTITLNLTYSTTKYNVYDISGAASVGAIAIRAVQTSTN